MKKDMVKIVELIMCYLLAAFVFSSFIWLIAYRAWDWKFCFLGLFSAFLLAGYTKVDGMMNEKGDIKISS